MGKRKSSLGKKGKKRMWKEVGFGARRVDEGVVNDQILFGKESRLWLRFW
jgi:hypothetical protein